MCKRNKVYICTECGKRPCAPMGWMMCWECEALWDAERTINYAHKLLADGHKKMAHAKAMLALAEQTEQEV